MSRNSGRSRRGRDITLKNYFRSIAISSLRSDDRLYVLFSTQQADFLYPSSLKAAEFAPLQDGTGYIIEKPEASG